MNGNNALRADTDSARRNTINPLLLLLEEQAAHIDALEGQVQALEQALKLDAAANVQSAFDISETLAQVLILLSDGKPRSKEQLHGALYYRRPDVDAPAIKITDTQLSKLRKEVTRHGVQINTVWGSGYQIIAGLHVVRGAMDYAILDAAEVTRRRKVDREIERQRRLRVERGCKDRQTYLKKSLSRQKPWEAEGVCRATWYARRRQQTGRLATNDNALVQSANHDSQVAA